MRQCRSATIIKRSEQYVWRVSHVNKCCSFLSTCHTAWISSPIQNHAALTAIIICSLSLLLVVAECVTLKVVAFWPWDLLRFLRCIWEKHPVQLCFLTYKIQARTLAHLFQLFSPFCTGGPLVRVSLESAASINCPFSSANLKVFMLITAKIFDIFDNKCDKIPAK